MIPDALEVVVVWTALIAGLGALIGLIFVPLVINERRSAIGTLMWVLALVLLPYIGLALYVTVGPRKISRRLRKRRRAVNEMSDSVDEVHARSEAYRVSGNDQDDPLYAALMSSCQSMGESVATCGNTVSFLRSGHKFERLFEAIEQAKDHIHLEYYTFENDETGKRLRELLIQKAQEGVEVRVLVDALGSLAVRFGFFNPLVRKGGRVATFLPARFVGRRFELNFRNHRKIVVIDGQSGFLGGINIGDEYSGLGAFKQPWHDVHIEVSGPAVHDLQEVFAEDWYFATGEDVAAPRYFPQDAFASKDPNEGSCMQIVTGGPDLVWPRLHHVFLTAIYQARTSIRIVTPYFVPTESLVHALVAARHRGVRVSLILPTKLDHPLVVFAARSYYEELLAAGAEIYEYDRRMIHAKAMTCDGSFCTVGSCNLDMRSLHLNFEINALLYDEHLTRELDTILDEFEHHARHLDPDVFSKRSVHKRLLENSARLLSPLL